MFLFLWGDIITFLLSNFLGLMLILMEGVDMSLVMMSSEMTGLLDIAGWSMLFLSKWVIILSLVVCVKEAYLSPGYSYVIYILGEIVCIYFVSSNSLSLYLFYELSLIPTLGLILGWGYQPERILATKMMLIYTMVFSLPLLSLLVLWGEWSSQANLHFMNLSSFKESSMSVTFGVALFSATGFLVKIPMYLVHLWLPKAHVEAPVTGSMILAGLLLKLGGLGLIRLSSFNIHMTYSNIVCSLALLGGGLVSVLCLSVVDMKVLVAYSSVSHMSFVISGLLLSSGLSTTSAILVMAAHGFASSGMFAGVNTLYEMSGSRNSLLNSGKMGYNPTFCYMWFLLIMSSMGTPPFASFFGEVASSISILMFNSWSIIALILLLFFGVSYSAVLYMSTSYGQSLMGAKKLYVSAHTKVVMISHMLLGLTLLGGLDLM